MNPPSFETVVHTDWCHVCGRRRYCARIDYSRNAENDRKGAPLDRHVRICWLCSLRAVAAAFGPSGEARGAIDAGRMTRAEIALYQQLTDGPATARTLDDLERMGLVRRGVANPPRPTLPVSTRKQGFAISHSPPRRKGRGKRQGGPRG